MLALIRGSAVNQDGRSNGLTAPNGVAQQALVRQALEDAGVAADAYQLRRGARHGHAARRPDRVRRARRGLARGASDRRALRVGSVKTNIGHLEAAAGIAGLIKVVLCLEREIPPHLHVSNLNPHLSKARP